MATAAALRAPSSAEEVEDDEEGNARRSYDDHDDEDDALGDNNSDDNERQQQQQLPFLFQEILRTRRTRNHFAPLPAASANANRNSANPDDEEGRRYWEEVLDRAALAGYRYAPNRKEPEGLFH